MAFGQNYASVDVNATLNMWNRLQPTVELGLGWAKSTPDDMNFTYRGKPSPYFKVGANYNFLFKNSPDYQAFLGIRLGYSTFSYDVTDVYYPSSYWHEELSGDITGEHSHALWGEAGAGLRVKLMGPISLGWMIRYHGIFNYGKSDHSRPWFIPGYGPRSSSLGLEHLLRPALASPGLNRASKAMIKKPFNTGRPATRMPKWHPATPPGWYKRFRQLAAMANKNFKLK